MTPPEPVTRVYDAAGGVLHDCAREGCAVSWDGYILSADAYTEQLRTSGAPAPLVEHGRGDPVAGRADVDRKAYAIDGRDARARG